MYLLNKADISENRQDLFECYSVSFEGQEYNKKKLDEVLSYCNPDLNNKFVFSHKANHLLLKADVPLFYPISTLLLVYFSRDNWQKNVDSKVVQYITNLLTMYDPTDLFSVYDSIKNDDKIKEFDNESLLVSYLDENNKDVAIFRDVFKHLNFKSLYSCEFGSYKSYINEFKNVKLYKPPLMDNYNVLSAGERNTKTLKLLQLKPNIK